ncbi:MAG: membrane protein of unknown function [Promethearchaeota archaeon]|nr:MAG: membrane protein of unknown function [Candidatus Lokiarchaeota archaeon]
MYSKTIYRNRIRIFVNFSLLVFSLFCFFTGIIKLLALFFEDTFLTDFSTFLTPFHDWTGIFFTILCGIHLFMRRQWMVAMTKMLIKTNTLGRKRWNYIINILMLASLILVASTGLLKLPLFIPSNGPKSAIFSIIDWIHDRSGFFMILFSGIHIFFHKRWLGMKFRITLEKQ